MYMIIKAVCTSQVALVVKNLPAKARDTRDACSIPALGRPPRGGKWQPISVFLPGKFHGQRSWRAAVHRLTKSWTRLRDWTHNTHRLNYCSELLIPFLPFTCMKRYISPFLEAVIIQVGTSNICCSVVFALLYLLQSLSEEHILGNPLPRKMNSYQGRWITNEHQDLANLETCSLKQSCPDTPTQTRQVLATAQTTRWTQLRLTELLPITHRHMRNKNFLLHVIFYCFFYTEIRAKIKAMFIDILPCARGHSRTLYLLIYLITTIIICQRRQRHPTPALLPGKSHGQRSLVGCSPWGR